MPEIGQINRTDAKHNPAQSYDSPDAIIAEVMMTRGEKLATLERWGKTIIDEMNATSEGMKTAGTSGDLVQKLDAVNKAIAQLKLPDANRRTISEEPAKPVYTSEIIASPNEDFPFMAVITDGAGNVVGEYPVRTEADGQAKIAEMLRDLEERDRQAASGAEQQASST